MDSTEHRSRQLAALEESLCSDPDIAFAVVFGSRTGGDHRRSSDLDVAVEFSADLSTHERFQKRCFLSGDLQHDDAPFVDVSDIEHLPLEVAHDAVRGTVATRTDSSASRRRSNPSSRPNGRPSGATSGT